MYIVFIIFIVVVIGICLAVKRKKTSASSMDNKIVSKKFQVAEGEFVITGRRNRFRICKNGNIEFLVENGQIVACKDKRVSDDFKFYGGE